MCIGKTHAQAREAFQAGGVELFVVAIAGPVLVRAGVARAHVIDEEYDDVGVHRCSFFLSTKDTKDTKGQIISCPGVERLDKAVVEKVRGWRR